MGDVGKSEARTRTTDTLLCFLSMGGISPTLPRTVPGVITLQKGQRFDWPTGATLRSDDGGTKQMTSDLTLSVARKREQQTKNGLQTKN